MNPPRSLDPTARAKSILGGYIPLILLQSPTITRDSHSNISPLRNSQPLHLNLQTLTS